MYIAYIVPSIENLTILWNVVFLIDTNDNVLTLFLWFIIDRILLPNREKTQTNFSYYLVGEFREKIV